MLLILYIFIWNMKLILLIMKSIYILVAIFLLVNCEQITTTDETTYAYFNFIKDAYN